ncbi:hypothetical protein EMIT0P265_10210 [Pseudomonas zeae]
MSLLVREFFYTSIISVIRMNVEKLHSKGRMLFDEI